LHRLRLHTSPGRVEGDRDERLMYAQGAGKKLGGGSAESSMRLPPSLRKK